MKYPKVFLILVIPFLLFCCVRARVSQYPGFEYASTSPNVVQIFNMPPAVPFEIIGEVEGRGAPAASWRRDEDNMKKRAASIGGDAVILIIRREPYAGIYSTPSTANAFISGNYIYYTYQPGTAYAMHRKHPKFRDR